MMECENYNQLKFYGIYVAEIYIDLSLKSDKKQKKEVFLEKLKQSFTLTVHHSCLYEKNQHP
jgi:hypothetical protein